MKHSWVVLFWLGVATASEKPDFTLKATIGVGKGDFAGSYVTELRIDRTVYLSKDYCAAAGMFGEYPAQVENEKIVRLSAGKKICRYRVFDTRPFLRHGAKPPNP